MKRDCPLTVRIKPGDAKCLELRKSTVTCRTCTRVAKKLAVVIIAACICTPAIAQEPVHDRIPIYSQEEYKSAWNHAASFGAYAGMYCMAQQALKKQALDIGPYIEDLNRCIEKEFEEVGATYERPAIP